MLKCIVGMKKYKIVYLFWFDSVDSELIGEVVEFFCGNFNNIGIDVVFVGNYVFIDRGNVYFLINFFFKDK